jgi:hypothetical protein
MAENSYIGGGVGAGATMVEGQLSNTARLLTSRIPSTAAEEGEVCVSAARLVAARSFP